MPGVADYLIARMRAAGVRTLFGLPGGGGNLDLIQAAGRAGLPFVLTATETGSAIAAIAQAEITGAPGACITTLGPGAASVVNGVACAKLERAPLLVITDSQVSDALFEHQRIDHHALLAPVVKWSGSLAPPNGHKSIDTAFAQLAAGTPGPVHLDCPADFESSVFKGWRVPEHPKIDEPLNPPAFLPDYCSAPKPLLIVGLASRRSDDDVSGIRSACKRLKIPALVTYKAKGVIPDDHPWFGGVFTHGLIEQKLIEQSSLLIGVGFDPVEILPRPWKYPQPVLSFSSWELPTDHVPFAHQHVNDIGETMTWVARWMVMSQWNVEDVRLSVDTARSAVRFAGADDPETLTAQTVVAAAAARFAGQARVTVDAGAHMLPAMMLWPASEPNEMLISNGLSTMGFALPAAIGAGLLDRSRPVVALIGDGGLLICMGELATLVRERLKVIVLVLNDSSLSLIEIKQQARKLPPAGVALGDLNWSRIAEGFGIRAWAVRTPVELEHALDAAAAIDGPSLIDATIDRTNYPDIMKAIRG